MRAYEKLAKVIRNLEAYNGGGNEISLGTQAAWVAIAQLLAQQAIADELANIAAAMVLFSRTK